MHKGQGCRAQDQFPPPQLCSDTLPAQTEAWSRGGVPGYEWGQHFLGLAVEGGSQSIGEQPAQSRGSWHWQQTAMSSRYRSTWMVHETKPNLLRSRAVASCSTVSESAPDSGDKNQGEVSVGVEIPGFLQTPVFFPFQKHTIVGLGQLVVLIRT